MGYRIVKQWHAYHELSTIEARAAERYTRVGYDSAAWPVTAPEMLEDYATRGLVWVALKDERAVGFATAERYYPFFHLEELNVLPELHGLGIGKALLQSVIDEALQSHFPIMSLRTFLAAPWSVGLYKKFGFKIIPESERPQFLGRHVASEQGLGVPPSHRCTMVLDLHEHVRNSLSSL